MNKSILFVFAILLVSCASAPPYDVTHARGGCLLGYTNENQNWFASIDRHPTLPGYAQGNFAGRASIEVTGINSRNETASQSLDIEFGSYATRVPLQIPSGFQV